MTNNEGYWIVALSVHPESVDLVEGLIWGLRPIGPIGLIGPSQDNKPLLEFTFRLEDWPQSEELLKSVRDCLSAAGLPAEIALRKEEDRDWWKEWQGSIQVAECGRIAVHPPWLDPPPELIPIVIEPKQAFGTGSHPTTRLVLETLSDLPPGERLIDWGTGSAVLAIAAIKLGWKRVLGIENDPEAITCALENIALNGTASEVEILCSANADWVASFHPQVIVANMLLTELIACREAILRALPPEGLLITTGLVQDQVAVWESLTAPRLRTLERRDCGEWCLLIGCGA